MGDLEQNTESIEKVCSRLDKLMPAVEGSRIAANLVITMGMLNLNSVDEIVLVPLNRRERAIIAAANSVLCAVQAARHAKMESKSRN